MKKSLKTLVAVVLSTMTLAACSSGTAASSTVKLGLNYELSGDVSTYGAGLVQGIEMAVAEINAAGGVLGKQIELVKADNKSQTGA